MLEREPLKRITLKEIKQHIWFNREIPSKKELTKDMRVRCRNVLERHLLSNRSRNRYFLKFDDDKRDRLQNIDNDYDRAMRQYRRKTENINKNLDLKNLKRKPDERSSSENLANYTFPRRHERIYKTRSNSERRELSNFVDETMFEIR